MDREKIQEVDANEIHYIQIFVWKLDPYSKKEGTRFMVILPVQEMVAMSLHGLDNGNGLQNMEFTIVYYQR